MASIFLDSLLLGLHTKGQNGDCGMTQESISAVTIIYGSYISKELKHRKIRPMLSFDLSTYAIVVCNETKNIS